MFHIFIDIVLDTRDFLPLCFFKITRRINRDDNVGDILPEASFHNVIDVDTIRTEGDNKVLLGGHYR
jgi:hypothetical protein